MQDDNQQTYQISEDGTKVTLYSASGNQQVFEVTKIEETIRYFAAIRAQMKPGVPVAAKDNEALHQLSNLYLKTIHPTDAPVKAGCLIKVLSKEFGWLDFPASASFCAQMHEWLASSPAGFRLPTGHLLN